MFSPRCQASFCCAFLHASVGEVREKRGGERSGEGGQQEKEEEEEEELEGFDAMQTGSTKARRQKFSIHHKNKSARVPALAQSDCKDGQLKGRKTSKFSLCNI